MNQRPQVGQKFAMSAQQDAGLDVQFQGADAQFLDPGHASGEDAADGHIAQHGPAPHPERPARVLVRPLDPAGRQLPLGTLDEPFEADGVDLVVVDLEFVTGGPGDEKVPVRLGDPFIHEEFTRVVNVRLQGSQSTARRIFPPQLLYQQVGRHHASGLERQQREHPGDLRCIDCVLSAVIGDDLEATDEVELHCTRSCLGASAPVSVTG